MSRFPSRRFPAFPTGRKGSADIAPLEDPMKKSIWRCYSLALSACARSGDILATYDGGTITRGELFDWAAFQRIDVEAMRKTKKMQESRLRMFAPVLAYAEAQASGFANNPDEAKTRYSRGKPPRPSLSRK